ncbi:MAG: hypothetical protein NTZ42_04790 [Candidatus Gribaldobacteria bacterium]|nr:hypothetical protein [Candidatus Gribaldobacteria bacterium]
MTTNNQTRAVVSAILYKEETGQKKIFLQTRWKPNTSPMYSGMLEIPAGGIDAYENVYDRPLFLSPIFASRFCKQTTACLG